MTDSKLQAEVSPPLSQAAVGDVPHSSREHTRTVTNRDINVARAPPQPDSTPQHHTVLGAPAFYLWAFASLYPLFISVVWAYYFCSEKQDYRACKVAQGIRVLCPASLRTCVRPLELACKWRERAGSTKLFSNLRICVMACAYPNICITHVIITNQVIKHIAVRVSETRYVTVNCLTLSD